MPDIVPLRPGLWLIETRLEDFDVRGVVLSGKRRAVVWDTLACPAHMEGVAELAGDLPLSVVYSHGDWDHVWGTDGLSRTWEEVVAHEGCGARFLGEIPRVLEEKRASVPGIYDGVKLVPPTRTFRTRLTLDLGDVTLDLHALPGHTSDTIVGHVPEWGLLLGGDAVEDPLPFLNPGARVMEWARGLEGWAGRLEESAPAHREEDRPDPRGGTGPGTRAGTSPPAALVVPSHGPVGGTGLLRANARYLRDLAAGKEPELTGSLTRFYRETHEANRILARG